MDMFRFRRALTVAIHPSSSTDHLDHSTPDSIDTRKGLKNSHDRGLATPGWSIHELPSDEEQEEGSSERLKINDPWTYKALPNLPPRFGAGTSFDAGLSTLSTSIFTDTVTIERAIHGSNDTRPSTISMSISQTQTIPTGNDIDSKLPQPHSIVNKVLHDARNDSSPHKSDSIEKDQLSEPPIPLSIAEESSVSDLPLETSFKCKEEDEAQRHTSCEAESSQSHPKKAENQISNSGAKLRPRKSASSFSSFLHNIADNNIDSSTAPPPSQRDDEERTRRRKRTPNPFPVLQPIVESGSSNPSLSASPNPTASPLNSPIKGLDTSFARKMEEAGRLRRLQSQNSLDMHASAQNPSIEPQSHLKSYSEDEAKAEGRMLRDLLDRTLRELKDTREEAERVTAQISWEKSRLVQELKSSNEDIINLRNENDAQRQTIIDLRSQLSKSEIDIDVLKKEKRSWVNQLDTMHHKVIQAERRIRCLGSLAHSKLEGRMEGAYGPTRRSAEARVSKNASAEVVGAVVALNEEIFQASNLLVERLERSYSVRSNASILRAKSVVGDSITTMLQTQRTSRSTGFNYLLMQVALEAFMIHWCTHIIEGWYPRHRSFADLLVELSSQTSPPNSGYYPECGKLKVLETTSSMTEKLPEWVSEIIEDLWKILSAGGLRLGPNRVDLLTSKLLIIVKMAYDVRTALAEKDICGDLDLSIVGPGIPFQAKWMDEAHHDVRNQNKSPTALDTEFVASTSGLGLQRLPADTNGKTSLSTPVMILKPKVVLVRVLEESP